VKKRAILIEPSGELSVVEADFGDWQRYVGGYVQMVPCELEGQPIDFVCNEEGMYDPSLMPNARANAILHGQFLGLLKGNVLLVGTSRSGNSTDVPAVVVKALVP
jgi:hypothetical protein